MVSRTSCWGSLTGSKRNKTWSRSVKMAVFAPMPRARVRTATAVKPGVRASMRKVYLTSRRTVSSQPVKVRRRVVSWADAVKGHLRIARGKEEESFQKFDKSTKRFVDSWWGFKAQKWRKQLEENEAVRPSDGT